MQQLVIVGGGFAGVWAARTAAGMRGDHEVEITLVSRDPWLVIRPRLYETSLDDARVPLDRVLAPHRVRRVQGEVTAIDVAARTLALAPDGQRIHYDRLVLATGSAVERTPIPGLEHAFVVDSYADAHALEQHLASPDIRRRATVVVIGAGFTGIEVATELATRLRAIADGARVIVLERSPVLAPDLGEHARAHVERAFATLGIAWRTGCTVAAIDRDGVTLDDGSRIEAATTVWTGGLRASPLGAQLDAARDGLGRLIVDEMLRVRGIDNVYAAGDLAHAMADATHVAPMSCQYAIPMGERAGANALAELVGRSPTPFTPPRYVTCLDLGAGGALFMEGWDREVRLAGFWAKLMKQTINTRLIYPGDEHAA